MAPKVLTGDKELDKALSLLADKVQQRLGRSALNAGGTVIAKKMKQMAPVSEDKSVKKSIGKRNKKNKRTGIHEFKVGINVAKKKKDTDGGKPTPVWAALGTDKRERKTIGGEFASPNPASDARSKSTGKIEGNDFILRAFQASEPAAADAIKKKMGQLLEKEAAKARK